MRSKLLPLLTTLILSSLLISCGTHAPFVDDCLIDRGGLDCSGKLKSGKANIVQDYTLTPLEADKYICRSSGDFLVSKIYISTLEQNLAKCIKTVVVRPKVSDCSIDGANQVLYCSDGISVVTVSWANAYQYLCVSNANFVILGLYQKSLIEAIAACTAS